MSELEGFNFQNATDTTLQKARDIFNGDGIKQTDATNFVIDGGVNSYTVSIEEEHTASRNRTSGQGSG